MKYLVFSLLVVAVLSATISGSFSADAANQTFAGVVTDSMCANGDHSQMQMGPTDAACTLACIDVHGASYVLYDGKNAYTLSDQKTPEKFAGQKVKVMGTLDAKNKTIRVDSITAAR